MAKRRLITTLSLAGFRPLVHQGTTVIAAYQQLVGLLGTRLPAHADLFAEPVADPAMTRVDWYSRLEGDVRRLDELSPAEAEPLRHAIDTAFSQIAALADEMSRSGDRHRETIGGIMRSALSCPPDGVYVIGGKPVCTGWGCVSSQVIGNSTSLTRFVQAGGAVEVESITRHGSTPTVSTIPQPPPAPRAAVAVAGAPGRPWPLWPLWALLGFAVVSLLAWLLLGLRPWLLDPGDPLMAAQQDELRLRAEINQLRGNLAAQRSGCTAPPGIEQRRAEAGGKTGVVTVTLIWDNGNDLDLIVLSPASEVLYYKRQARSSPSGGELDVDANYESMMGAPVENVVWQTTAPRGTYKVFVEHSGSRGGGTVEPTVFTVKALSGGQEKSFRGKVTYGKRPSDRYKAAFLKAVTADTDIGTAFILVGTFDY